MTYRLDRGGRRSKKSTVIALGVFFFVVVFFWPSLRPFIYSGVEPFSKRVFELTGGVSIVPEFIRVYFSSREALVLHEQLLQSQVENLENKVIEQELTLRELRELLGNTSSSSYKYGVPIVAAAVAQDLTKIYSSVIFSKGFGDGVGVGDRVYLRKRQVICEIKEVYARTSFCELYSGFGNKVEGVTSSSSINITLKGRGGHYVADIVRDTSVAVGEKILLRDNQSFVLGEVTQVFSDDQDTSWRIFVRGEYNPANSSLYYVEKIKE
jgi:hypothetical protein